METASSWIDGLEFPAKKLDLIDAAEEAGAPNEAIGRLQQLQGEQYESREQLGSELG